MKKQLTAACAALTLTVSLGASAFAAPVLISANPNYSGTITVNGEDLDVSGLPAAPAGAVSVPLRAVAEADYGFADWYPEEAKSYFALDTNRVYIGTADGSIEVNGETVTGMTATFVEGVTYVPVALLDHLDGYTAEVKDSAIAIATPNGQGLVKLARQILDATETGATMKQTAAEMDEYFGLSADNFDEIVGFFPMMTNPDTLILAKVKPGKMDDVKAQLETYRQKQEDTFSWYLVQHLEKVQNAQTVTKGDYVMFLIADETDTAVQMFKDGVK